MKFAECKNEKGQVLLMVIITSTIALLIVTGVFLRVLKLSRQGVEMENHDIAFSTAEKYARQILNQLDQGETPDVSNWAADDETYPNLAAASMIARTSVSGFPLKDGADFEIADATPGSETFFTLDSNSWNGATILFTTVYYNGNTYSIEKKIFDSCNSSEGNLSAVACSRNALNDVFTYTHQPNEVTVRVKVIGSDVSMSVDSQEILFNEFLLTTNVEGTLSEASLKVSTNKSMPSLFDHVLYNGKGAMSKVY